MKNLVLLLAFLLAPVLAPVSASAGITNVDALAVGSEAEGTYSYLTGVTYAYVPLEISGIKQGDGFSVPASVSIATGAYWGQVTGLTNHAALVLPAVDSVSLTVQTIVPLNYRSGGALQILLHASGTLAAATDMTFTADVYLNSPSSTTVTTKSAGTAVNPATAVGVQAQWLTLTNSNATYVPGAIATWKLDADGVLQRKEILGARFRYRPGGVFNGQ